MQVIRSAVAFVAISVAVSGQVKAEQYLLSWQGELTSTAGALAGAANVGDMIFLDVYVDNGGDSVISQTWTSDDTVSASLTVNAYSAQYIADFFPSDGFVTDGAGNLILADWFGTEDSAVNSDIFGVGGGVRLFNGAISAFDGELSFYEPTFGNTADWTGPTLVVPEPSTFLIGFVTCAMLLGAGRRRQIST